MAICLVLPVHWYEMKWPVSAISKHLIPDKTGEPHMKKKLLLCMFLVSGLCMQGQVIVNLQLPPLGLTIKPQLWNLSLINTTADNIDVRIELVMTDISNNQRVLTATSNLLTLPKGVKQLQPPDVMPVTYNMGSSGYGVDPNP